MVSRETMDILDTLGFGCDIDKLEKYVEELQDKAFLGEPVADSVYDMHERLLRQLRPEAECLNRNWESDEFALEDYDTLLDKYGMCGILTVTSLEDLKWFKDILREIGKPVDLAASVKENGHGLRAVYKYGNLIGGSTRGRDKKGREINRHLKLMLPNRVDEWGNTELVEVRGEGLVKIATFEEKLKGKLKTPLSSVTSLIKDSATDEEISLLDMVCYKVLSSNDIGNRRLSDEFGTLARNGFSIPQGMIFPQVTVDNFDVTISKIVAHFEKLKDEGKIPYSCDGIVVTINDTELFYSLGKLTTGKDGWRGNFAIKMGKHWSTNVYQSKILAIEYSEKKVYKTPKAKIEPVITANGSEVSTVPLYNIGVMEKYGYTVGKTVYFRYGGETGVTCVDYDGNSVKGDTE